MQNSFEGMIADKFQIWGELKITYMRSSTNTQAQGMWRKLNQGNYYKIVLSNDQKTNHKNIATLYMEIQRKGWYKNSPFKKGVVGGTWR